MNLGVAMAPVSIVVVCRSTSPFWISIFARITLKEPIMCTEIIGMVICFAMVVAIALSAK